MITSQEINQYEPGENQIGNIKSIPCGMFEKIVVSSAIIYEDHDYDTHPVEEKM